MVTAGLGLKPGSPEPWLQPLPWPVHSFPRAGLTSPSWLRALSLCCACPPCLQRLLQAPRPPAAHSWERSPSLLSVSGPSVSHPAPGPSWPASQSQPPCPRALLPSLAWPGDHSSQWKWSHRGPSDRSTGLGTPKVAASAQVALAAGMSRAALQRQCQLRKLPGSPRILLEERSGSMGTSRGGAGGSAARPLAAESRLMQGQPGGEAGHSTAGTRACLSSRGEGGAACAHPPALGPGLSPLLQLVGCALSPPGASGAWCHLSPQGSD